MSTSAAHRAAACRCCLVLLALTLLLGCATPISVAHTDPKIVHRELSTNALSAETLSQFSQNVLRQYALDELAATDAPRALRSLHAAATADPAQMRADDLFALAELAFELAEATHSKSYDLAAAAYSFAFLFPEGSGEPPDPFDPRFRWAVDIYNRAVTNAFRSADGTMFEPQSVTADTSAGRIAVSFDPGQLGWSGRQLVDFVPVADLALYGLRNRYRNPGLGAPLAAGTIAEERERGLQVAALAKIPLTAVLRFANARQSLATGGLRASLELYPAAQQPVVSLAGRSVPLESEPTATLALTLSNSAIWSSELRGFFLGDILRDRPSQLVSVQPHIPGRIPVVFVHGTGSSVGRWADMLNDLSSDPKIRSSFEFWFFGYETGNPIPYSAMVLREALHDAVEKLDPQGRDPALQQMVVIGHSQGGLLTKMMAINTEDRLWSQFSTKPMEELSLSEETRDLLRRALFFKAVPEVRRVIYIATPHRGSYAAQWQPAQLIARFIRLPFRVLGAMGEVISQNVDDIRLRPDQLRFGSIYGMTPGSPLITALSPIPLARGVAAHSIVAVEGNGPVEDADDGIVAYKSAHLDNVESELVIRSGHSVQSNPLAVAEVRRILLLHAAQASAPRIAERRGKPTMMAGTR